MREQFEKVADEQLGVVGALIGLERDGEGYKAEAVNGAWTIWKCAWQAAVAAEREQIVKLINAEMVLMSEQENLMQSLNIQSSVKNAEHFACLGAIGALQRVASAIRDGGSK